MRRSATCVWQVPWHAASLALALLLRELVPSLPLHWCKCALQYDELPPGSEDSVCCWFFSRIELILQFKELF